jgi:tetratricopeptide (TPR) repeat protein
VRKLLKIFYLNQWVISNFPLSNIKMTIMKKHFVRALSLSFILNCCINVQAQDSLKINLRNEAQKHFFEKDYVQALPLYRELLRSFPKEPEYQYRTGVCLVNLNSDQDDAIRLLRSASVSNYEPMTWYYLGRALHLYYSFEDAIKAYSKFILNGKSADVKSLDVERLIEMAKNGQEFTQTGRNIKVQNTRTIQIDQLQLAAEINGSGKLMKKPVEFCSKTDLRNGFRPWMFLPVYTEINEYVYVTGYEKGERNKKQLFRIKNINHETWGTPEPLNTTINTPYDEEFPYFDSKSSALYFSSKGHSSMGGYDIFKSVYDWNTKSWSTPENLGFPINSPYDDFVFITDGFDRSASFVSTRNSAPNQAIIYRIRLEQDTTGIRFVNIDDIRKASQLLIQPVEQESAEKTAFKKMPEQDISAVEHIATTVPVRLPVKSNYNKVLADALLLQIKADSLSRITRDMRITAKETPDEVMKKQLITDILKTDKEAKSLQREADKKFMEARNLRKNDENRINQFDSTVHLAKEINGINIYQYNTIITEDDQEAMKLSDPYEKQADDDSINSIKTDDFTLLEKSPYGGSNPIPQGLNTYPGLIYRIQLGVFSKPKPSDAFGGISPVALEQVAGSGILKYYAGLFYSLNAVASALEKVRSNGFPDAFIVAFFDGKLITTERAREIEFAEFEL